jgi:hypothetical protein
MSSTDERARDPQLNWMNWPYDSAFLEDDHSRRQEASLCGSVQLRRPPAKEIIRNW